MGILQTEVYSPREIARAARVPVERVVAALGHADLLVGHDQAVRLGRSLVAASPSLLFASVCEPATPRRAKGVSLAVSSTVHAGIMASAVFLTTLSLSPTAAVLPTEARAADPMHLVYLTTPGPGGGGGGGGLRQPAPPPKARRQGLRRISSPVRVRRPPPRIEAAPPEPTPPPLISEPLPVLVAPIVSAPADDRNRIGVFESVPTETKSQGPGQGGGAGKGNGVGVGPGSGPGIGPGSDGGTGGGPFRPGSGIEPPRLLREVKADYTEDARRRGLEGEVIMEIVVTRSGSVRDIKFLRRLGGGLDERAEQAVRQWRFAPAMRQGVAVDVMVEVAVEFNLR